MDQVQKNAADEGQVKAAKEKTLDAKTRERNALLKIMEDHNTGLWLMRKIHQFHTYESPVAGPDHLETQRRIGVQAAGRALRKECIEANAKRFYELEFIFLEER